MNRGARAAGSRHVTLSRGTRAWWVAHEAGRESRASTSSPPLMMAAFFFRKHGILGCACTRQKLALKCTRSLRRFRSTGVRPRRRSPV
jgi:hypothetical protein